MLLLAFSAFFSSFALSQDRNHKDKKDVKTAQPSSVQLSKMESSVVSELNIARKNPEKYIAYLEERRNAMHGNVIKRPNQKDVKTHEGKAAVDEAIGDLRQVSGLTEFQVSDGLNKAARAQLTDLQEDSKLGHFGKDGSDLKARIARFGTAKGKCGENICYNGTTAKDVVAIFLIDDGVSSRSHRKTVISDKLKQIGVACGSGKNSEPICVVIFAADFKDKTADSGLSEF